jgi:hypothetical protein
VSITSPRPAEVCRGLLAALEASEGRRKRRKRDTTPDAIGLGIKRDVLERAVGDDPEPEAFEAWLMEQTLAPPPGHAPGSLLAMALQILDEWRAAVATSDFGDWLARGAPSDDRAP